MSSVLVTIKIMPDSPERDLESVKQEMIVKIEDFGGRVAKTEIEEIAFGLKALKIIFIMDESLGDLEPLEESLKDVEGVESVETIDVRRAIG